MTSHTFDDADHPRQRQGKFAHKRNAAPAGSLHPDEPRTAGTEPARGPGAIVRGMAVLQREGQQLAQAAKADIVGAAHDIFD